MKLRVRILLGYGYLVALLLVAAGSAMLGFFQLSERIESVLERNSRTLRATTELIDTIERQDSATLSALLAGEGVADQELSALDNRFLEALDQVAEKLPSPSQRMPLEKAEPRALAGIRSDFESYREQRDGLLEGLATDLATPRDQALAAYQSDVYPRFAALKQDLIELLDRQHRVLLAGDEEARLAALRNGAWLGLLVSLALISLMVLSRVLQRDLLSRIEDLRRGLRAATAGDEQRRLRPSGQDELAKIAEDVNLLLDRVQDVEGRSRSRVALQRRLVVGLVEAYGEGAVLYDVNGRVLAGSRGLALPASRHDSVAAWILGRAGSEPSEGTAAKHTVDAGDCSWSVSPVSSGGQTVGWISQPSAQPAAVKRAE